MHAEQFHFIKTAFYAWQKRGFQPADDIKSILVVKMDEIGDMVTALHVFDHLRVAFPNAKITVWCKKFNHNLLDTHPGVDHIVHGEEELEPYYSLVVDLRSKPEHFKTIKRLKPKGYYCRGSVQIAKKRKGQKTHEIETNFLVVQPLLAEGKSMQYPKIYTTSEDEAFAKTFAKEYGLDKICLFHVGARDKARQWPLDRFALLGDYLAKKGYQIVFVGGPSDQDAIDQCRVHLYHPTYSLAGQTTLRQMAAICEISKLYVGNESGPMHIADRYDIPLIGLYGPGVADIFYPVNPKSKVIHYFKEKNHTQQTPEDSTILKITVEEVIKAVDEMS